MAGANLTCFEWSSSFDAGLWRILVLRVSLGEGRTEYACSCSFGTISINRFCSIFPPHHQVVGEVWLVWRTGWHHCSYRWSWPVFPPMGLVLVASCLWLD